MLVSFASLEFGSASSARIGGQIGDELSPCARDISDTTAAGESLFLSLRAALCSCLVCEERGAPAWDFRDDAVPVKPFLRRAGGG